MALTKIGSIGINTGIQLAGVTTLSTLNASNNVLSVGGTVNFTGNVSIAGTLTYEDVTNVDSVGIITARSNILVGSGITLSPDGDIFTTGISTFTDDVTFTGAAANIKFDKSDNALEVNDDAKITFGTGADITFTHSGADFAITNTTGNLNILNNSADAVQIRHGNETMIKAVSDGAVELYHDDSKKLETASGGVTVTGTVAATSYTGDGSALTGIQVGLTTTSAQVSGITTVIDLDKDDIRLDCTGLVTIDTKGGSEGNSHTLRIVNSGISTVTFNSYFKFPSGGTPNLPTASGAISLISFTVHTQGRVGVASVFLAGSSVNFS